MDEGQGCGIQDDTEHREQASTTKLDKKEQRKSPVPAHLCLSCGAIAATPRQAMTDVVCHFGARQSSLVGIDPLPLPFCDLDFSSRSELACGSTQHVCSLEAGNLFLKLVELFMGCLHVAPKSAIDLCLKLS